MSDKNILFNSDIDTCKIFESILFYLSVSRTQVLSSGYEFGPTGSPAVVPIVDCINYMRAVNEILSSPAVPDLETYAVSDWISNNQEKFSRITE